MHIDHKQQNTLPSFDYVQKIYTIDYFASKLFSAAIYENSWQSHAYLVRKYISIFQPIDATNLFLLYGNIFSFNEVDSFHFEIIYLIPTIFRTYFRFQY